MITDLARRELKSYRQLPVNFYQIQTKFRDEIRPRFGVMRAREFTMKDAYSFHLDAASLEQGYQAMHDAYSRIFARMNLRFRAVRADTGSIGGSASQEFHVLADSGEDAIAFSDGDDYAANLEMAEALPPAGARPAATAALAKVATPNVRTIAELTAFLKVAAARCVKTLLVEGTDGGVVALVVRGDHELNAVKAQKLPGVLAPLRWRPPSRCASPRDARRDSSARSGSSSRSTRTTRPRTSRTSSAAPTSAMPISPAPTGAATCPSPSAWTSATSCAGDPSPSGRGTLGIARGIEVGHIFQLGRKYSEAMNATVLDEQGKSVVMFMGCYGIGVTRVVAAAIEQNNDERGIVWPEPIAPFQVSLIPINLQKSERVRETAERLYSDLQAAGFEVVYDDRDARPGVKFADDELLGIPHRVVVGDKGLERGVLEYKPRSGEGATDVPVDSIVQFLRDRSHVEGLIECVHSRSPDSLRSPHCPRRHAPTARWIPSCAA